MNRFTVISGRISNNMPNYTPWNKRTRANKVFFHADFVDSEDEHGGGRARCQFEPSLVNKYDLQKKLEQDECASLWENIFNCWWSLSWPHLPSSTLLPGNRIWGRQLQGEGCLLQVQSRGSFLPQTLMRHVCERLPSLRMDWFLVQK